jgi:hypothetical protein
VVPDTASVPSLAERLSAAFGSERISVDPDSREVGILVEQDSDRGVLRALDAVEHWYAQAEVGSVEMWLGERSFTFARWLPVQTW